MIIKPETKRLLAELSQTQYWVAMKEYLDIAVNELKDVTTCESWDEVQGRKFSKKFIEDLFVVVRKNEPNITGKSSYE